MEYITGKSSNEILHIIYRGDSISEDRLEVIPRVNQLQFSPKKLHKGASFRPHYHIPKQVDLKEVIAQEAWAVIKGSIKARYYDTDELPIDSVELHAGDVSVTLSGGHTFEVLEDDTIIYEFKTGPYLGVELDKRFLDGIDPYLQTR